MNKTFLGMLALLLLVIIVAGCTGPLGDALKAFTAQEPAGTGPHDTCTKRSGYHGWYCTGECPGKGYSCQPLDPGAGAEGGCGCKVAKVAVLPE